MADEGFRHQKQALTFMLRREEGWSMQGPYKDIWTIRDSDQGRLCVPPHGNSLVRSNLVHTGS